MISWVLLLCGTAVISIEQRNARRKRLLTTLCGSIMFGGELRWCYSRRQAAIHCYVAAAVGVGGCVLIMVNPGTDYKHAAARRHCRSCTGFDDTAGGDGVFILALSGCWEVWRRLIIWGWWRCSDWRGEWDDDVDVVCGGFGIKNENRIFSGEGKNSTADIRCF